MLKTRASGLLLHICSLPGRFGIGDFGPQARRFADFLKQAGQRYWQILPLNLTAAKAGYSPYDCYSAFAGNSLFVSPELLVERGLLERKILAGTPSFPAGTIDYPKAASFKERCLKKAWRAFQSTSDSAAILGDFVCEHEQWLNDFSLYMALKKKYGSKVWAQWPAATRDRDPNTLIRLRKKLQPDIEYELFRQYLFYEQYASLKKYCNQLGIQIFGDLPIYVRYDSADVWSHPELFKLNTRKRPEFIAGVGPDYFSKTGQLWKNPVYNWKKNAQTKYRWWLLRMKHNLALFDLLRIDHFRGFEAYWQIPAKSKTAIDGQWVKGPGKRFFNQLLGQFSDPPIVVEDLGYITDKVRELKDHFRFPGMCVLQFAFDEDDGTSPHLPQNHPANSVVYTGTHDNNTTRGWFTGHVKTKQKKRITEILGKPVSTKTITWEMIHLAMHSTARLSMIPMQDLLNLPAQARMNTPPRARGNWKWRLKTGQLRTVMADKLRSLTKQAGRL